MRRLSGKHGWNDTGPTRNTIRGDMSMANVCIARDEDGCFSRYTDLGGYPLYHIVDDGGVLCPDCANEHGHTEERNDGWRIVASDVNWEDNELHCDHCGEPIPAAYGEDD
jgi:hypothetical protein